MKKLTSIVFGLLYLCYFLSFAIFAMNLDRSPPNLLWGLLITILITVWCTADAKNRKFPLPHAYQFSIFLFGPIGWAVYALSSRGFAGGLKFIGLQMLIFFLVSFMGLLVGMSLYGNQFIAR